ncbi:cysteine desulfurase [Candidatus Dependentiae bacterium]|nr:cysteine desulfurase [Candidatus Dependentiae bacterium]
MKNLKKIIILMILLDTSIFYTLEVGKNDGGEYCCYRPGSKEGSMFLYDFEKNKSGGCSLLGDNELEQISFTCENMDFVAVREQFPIFKQQVHHDKPLIYFDSGATAQMPQVVIDAIVDYYQHYKSNVGRGLYEFAEKATKKFETARLKVAHFIGAQAKEIVFTSGATAGINLVVHIWAKYHIKKGDEIIISEVEHNANFIPWKKLADQTGALLRIVPLNQYGTIDINEFKKTLSSKTKLVAITHQSNVLGTTNDIAQITNIAHQVGAKVLVDAAQSVAHQKVNVKEVDCDFFVFSGHKLFGPTGVGVLFIKQSLFEQCVLQNFGGGMVYEVTLDKIEFKEIPHVLEPGTQAIAQVIGLGEAIDFVQKNINFQQAQEHETSMVCMLALALQKIPGVTVLSPIPQKGAYNSLVTFTVEQCHAYDVAEYLDQHGIAVRAGYHCAQPYHDKMGGKASVRITLSVYNTEEEVAFLIQKLTEFLK